MIARERNPERRDFYELCWHLGGSQSDIAALKGEDFDCVNHSFCYARTKTANMGGTKWSASALQLIKRRPRVGLHLAPAAGDLPALPGWTC